jgi:hypothetical protein
MAAEGVFPKVDGDILYETDIHAVAGIISAASGENLTAGDVVFIYGTGHANAGKAYKSDANVQALNRATGIALETVTSPAEVKIMTRGIYTTTGLTANTDYYLSTTAGAYVATTVSAVKIGMALSTTELFVNIVQDDRDALGTIKPWLKDHAGMPAAMSTLSAFWKACDGTVINNAESPLNNGGAGEAPNLNGAADTTKKFLRGATTSDVGTDNTITSTATHNHQSGSYSEAYGGGSFAATEGNATSTTSSHIPPSCDVYFIMKII